MSECRDWLSTLWPGSYKGVPFHYEEAKENGGRGLVVHTFPHRDDPFVEDMGEEPRYFEGTIYIHGDDVDGQEQTLKAAFASVGPGVLVDPLGGPVSVHCQTFERVHQKDQLGYVAFSVKFVRAGAASAFVSVPLLGRLVLGAADGLASALGTLFPTVIHTVGVPDFVVAAASDGIAQAAATVDALRLSTPVDPTVSARVRDANAAIVAAAPLLITSGDVDPEDIADLASATASFGVTAAGGPDTLAAALAGTIRALANGMAPETAQAAMATLAESLHVTVAATYPSPLSRAAAVNAAESARLARLATLTAWAEALVRRSYASRSEGLTARGEAAERFENELSDCNGAEFAALYLAIEALRGQVVDYLSRLIADLAPVVTVEANRSLPSLYWAWRLYADPTRADELVARNSVRHPSFMPRTFTALAR